MSHPRTIPSENISSDFDQPKKKKAKKQKMAKKKEKEPEAEEFINQQVNGFL